mgnify:FL=1
MKDDTAFDWGTHSLEDAEDLEVALGPLRLRIWRTSGEIRLAYWRENEVAGLVDPRDPSGPDRWIRWVPTPGWSGQLQLTPILPTRPLVVRPDHAFRLMQDSEARIYVRVPVELQVEVGDRTLLQVPTRVLSDTWWGSTEVGKLHYFLDTQARRQLGDGDFEEHLAMCPVQLRNGSPEELTVHRISLQTEFLSLYRDGTRLWSDTTTVRYRGADEDSDLRFGGKAPQEAPDAELIGLARRSVGRGFSARTFARQLRSSLKW